MVPPSLPTYLPTPQNTQSHYKASPLSLTSYSSPEEDDALNGEGQVEEDEESVVVEPDTAGQPQAMVVKPIAATVAKLAVLGPIRNNYLQ